MDIQIIKETVWLFAFLVPLFWAVLFFLKRRQGLSFFYASLLFFCVSLNYMDTFFDMHGYLWGSVVTNALLSPSIFLMPIFFIFYMFYFTSIDGKLPGWVYWLFILPVAFFIYSSYAFYFCYPFSSIKEIFFSVPFHSLARYELSHVYLVQKIRIYSFIFSIFVTIISSVFFIPRIIKSVEQEFSNIRERIVMRFLILLSVVIIVGVAYIVYYLTGKHYLYIMVVSMAGFFFMGYLMYKELVFERNLIVLSQNEPKEESPMLSKITRYFEGAKPWLEPDLKIGDVAHALGTNRTYLSTLLNEELQTNFNHFVNSYRIAEAKRLLKNDGITLKMQEIAAKCGFNSYSTFFSAFRNETGISPKEFISGGK